MMNKAENIRYMILKQCRRRSLTELCDAWEVTIDDFYAYLDSKDKLLGNTADEWMGMYHIAADRADKAEAEVERLQTNMIKYEICYDTTRESYDKAEAENAKLRAALSKVEDMCVSFHEGGPYQDNEEVRRIMEIYDIAHSALEGGGADG